MPTHRFKVKTGVRLVDIGLRKHIPPHLKIDGQRTLILYEGQSMTCYRCSEQSYPINDCPRRKGPGSQQTSHNANSWANMVKRDTDKAPSVGNNGTNNVSLFSNGEARQVIEFQSRLLDQDAHNKQDPMTVEHHLCPPADEVLSLSDDINKTDNIVRMDEEPGLTPPDTHATSPNATKWSDLISN